MSESDFYDDPTPRKPIGSRDTLREPRAMPGGNEPARAPFPGGDIAEHPPTLAERQGLLCDELEALRKELAELRMKHGLLENAVQRIQREIGLG